LVLYLFIPAFVYAARRYRPLQIAAMGAVLAAGVFAALLPTTPVIDILYWGLPGRLVEFGAGFALGYAGRGLGARLRPVALAVA
ncbi:hypothetical protein ACC848_42665, partial [Rhizobium johnstonii]